MSLLYACSLASCIWTALDAESPESSKSKGGIWLAVAAPKLRDYCQGPWSGSLKAVLPCRSPTYSNQILQAIPFVKARRCILSVRLGRAGTGCQQACNCKLVASATSWCCSTLQSSCTSSTWEQLMVDMARPTYLTSAALFACLVCEHSSVKASFDNWMSTAT